MEAAEAPTKNAFTQALQQPGVVKGQFDLLYASLCRDDDDEQDSVDEEEEEESDDEEESPPRGGRQHHGGRGGGKRWKGTALMAYDDDEEEEEEGSDEEDEEEVVVPTTKKRRRAVGHADQGQRRRAAPPPPLPPRYDEEELRHSWKPLGNAGDDYMEMTALGCRKEGLLMPPAGKGRNKWSVAAAAAAAKREGSSGAVTTGEQGADWLQTRKAVVPAHRRTRLVGKKEAFLLPPFPAVVEGAAAAAVDPPADRDEGGWPCIRGTRCKEANEALLAFRAKPKGRPPSVSSRLVRAAASGGAGAAPSPGLGAAGPQNFHQGLAASASSSFSSRYDWSPKEEAVERRPCCGGFC